MRAVLYFSICLAAVAVGCQKSLFPSGVPRSQFEMYDKSRGQWVPRETEGYKGRKEVDLRKRLKPHRPQAF
ncbi:MAG: hypothetical protein R3236_09645 [Phycisphaeraceae bacterium]|nr:hypothetical protein [Phycisphaeraceae bacterium]